MFIFKVNKWDIFVKIKWYYFFISQTIIVRRKIFPLALLPKFPSGPAVSALNAKCQESMKNTLFSVWARDWMDFLYKISMLVRFLTRFAARSCKISPRHPLRMRHFRHNYFEQP